MSAIEDALPPGATDLSVTDEETGAAVLACFTNLNKFQHDKAIQNSRSVHGQVIPVSDLLPPDADPALAERVDGFSVRCFPDLNEFEAFAYRSHPEGGQYIPLPPEVL
jgi:hypothetical protein